LLNAAADYWTSLKKIGVVDVKQETIVQLLMSPRLRVADFMETYWHDLSADDKDLLRCIINGGRLTSNRSSSLLELGILKTNGLKTEIASRLFEEWIRTSSPANQDPKWQQLRRSSLVHSWIETGRLLFDLETGASKLDDTLVSVINGQNNFLKDQLNEYGLGIQRVLERLDKLEDGVKLRLDSFLVVYQQVSDENQALLADMLSGIDHICQDEQLIKHAVEQVHLAVEQTRKNNGTNIGDDVRRALEVLGDKGSKLEFNQKFELTLPVIPFLLNYSASFDGGVELGAVWDELCTRIKKRSK
jgi:hypothetical protein